MNYSSLFVLLKRLAALLAIFTLCRILFYAFNHTYFSELGFTGFMAILYHGVYFDASTAVLLNFVFIFLALLPFPFRERLGYARFQKWLFMIVNSIALLSNCTDLVYFQFTTKRTTADVFSFFGGGIGNDLGRLLPLFLKDYWYVVLIWIALVWLLAKSYNKAEKQRTITWDKKQYIRQSLVFMICGAAAVIVYRGGFQLRPIGIVNAGEYVDSKNVPLVLNTPFSILKSMEVQGIEPSIYFTDEAALKKQFDPYHVPHPKGEFKKINVFVIALESFSKEYVGALNHRGSGYTPFLDSLIGQSLTFVNAFSNGKKSIEGIPSIIASIPTWTDEPYITSRYGSNQINSLASILKAEGYNTSFFHGGTDGTMGFDAFAKLVGYDNYYGRKEYNNEKDYDGNWGIWDEEFLQYTANMVNKKQQPFFATLFTLTSHHPYPMPDKYKGKFKDGPLEIEKTIGYSDFALRRFFETAKKMPWFNNTLFVLSADHTGISNDPFYTNRIGNYSIPILYYMPGSDLKGLDSTVTQQIDIMPSILDYLNYPKPYFAFGNSVFDTTGAHYAMTFNSGRYQLLENYYSTEFTSYKTDLYYYKKDSFLHYNLKAQDKDLMLKMETRIKAIIQTYQQSIINNKMH
ncbi:MAG: sulfatase [Bacteroidetes bacterium]|nr:sulfatase [Bacteroidota bacterium]